MLWFESNFYIDTDFLICVIEKEGKVFVSIAPTWVVGVFHNGELSCAKILNYEGRTNKIFLIWDIGLFILLGLVGW